MEFDKAFLEPLNSEEEYIDVVIHDNGWIEATEPGTRGRRLYISPGKIEHVNPISS